jgi:hypothetical protein
LFDKYTITIDFNLFFNFRKKRDGEGDTVSLNEMALSSAENGNAHKKLSDWRNKLASKFKKSVGDQVTILLMKFALKKIVS